MLSFPRVTKTKKILKTSIWYGLTIQLAGMLNRTELKFVSSNINCNCALTHQRTVQCPDQLELAAGQLLRYWVGFG